METNRNLRVTCASCVGAVGIASCTIPMLLAAVGVVAIASSQASGMTGMTTHSDGSFLSDLVGFLSGAWGATILTLSFVLMAYGMWSVRKPRTMAIGLAAAVFLFSGMYLYPSVVLTVIGLIGVTLAYASAYSVRLANLGQLVARRPSR